MVLAELIQFVQTVMKTYDSILFVYPNLQDELLVISLKGKFENNLILSAMEDKVINQSDWIFLEKDICNALCRLYHTYEFSNKFKLLSADSNYGSIWNYVKTGLLSPEEVISALLD